MLFANATHEYSVTAKAKKKKWTPQELIISEMQLVTFNYPARYTSQNISPNVGEKPGMN